MEARGVSFSQLRKGMYFDSPISTAFGLLHGQARARPIAQDVVWFNGRGEMLGCGDLDERDFLQIMEWIDDWEKFVVLQCMPDNTHNEAVVSVEHLCRYAAHVVTRDTWYWVCRSGGRGHVRAIELWGQDLAELLGVTSDDVKEGIRLKLCESEKE